MAQFKNYSPQFVTVSFNGVILTGFADGTFVEVEREDDAFTKRVGSQGDVVRVQSMNRSGKITVTLQNQSPTNDILAAFALTDEQTGLGTGTIQIKDKNTASIDPLAVSGVAWIMKLPKIDRAKEATNSVWVFECAQLQLTPSGAVV